MTEDSRINNTPARRLIDSSATKISLAALLTVVILVAVPIGIEMSGRFDLFYTLSTIWLLSIASAGVWITFFIGRINIGQGAFALAGGYVSAILVSEYGISFWLTIPLAGAFSAAVGLLVGLPILRLRGVYFAMVTLVLTEVARLSAMALPITNKTLGIANLPLPGPVKLFHFTVIPDFAEVGNVRLAFYLLSGVLMLLSFGLAYRLVHSRVGRLFSALRQNEELASSMGVNVAKLRIIAYAISCFFGGVAGVLYAAISQSMYPSSFSVIDSVNFMLNCFLGGLGYVFGPLIGTFVLRYGWSMLFTTGQYQLLIYSGVIIILIMFLPNGLISIFDRAHTEKKN